MKKLLTASALALTLALGLGISACSDGGKAEGNGTFGDLTTAESVYGFSAASAGMLISSMNGGAPAKSFSAVALSADTSVSEGERADLSELDSYMALVESLLSEGGFTSSVTASEREGYANKMTVAYRDIDGNSLGYEMYYNETALPADDDDDDDHFEDETEENYAIEGVLVIEGADYAVRGTRNAESERGESESETEFRVTLGEDRYMYVEQSEEREGEETEQEYTYSLREGGSLVERSTFSYETERGETELKMTSYKGGQSKIFYFEKENYRGEEVVFIRVGNNQSAQGYIVETVTDENGTRYEYIPVNGR